ncbi:MAG: hypothetical protein NTX50_16080 [Candidatus Sumerlaeota bacterium]|nr:hypothetical protein [Candidatus Sumerlaeota bacterium]
MNLARTAFLEESWPALAFRHAGKDPLFSAEGYRAYALDLLERMANPWLRDAVERVVRDPRRKLGWNDRLIGVMRLALNAGVAPRCYALGAAQAFAMLRQETGKSLESLAAELWNEPGVPVESRRAILEMIEKALRDEKKKCIRSG